MDQSTISSISSRVKKKFIFNGFSEIPTDSVNDVLANIHDYGRVSCGAILSVPHPDGERLVTTVEKFGGKKFLCGGIDKTRFNHPTFAIMEGLVKKALVYDDPERLYDICPWVQNPNTPETKLEESSDIKSTVYRECFEESGGIILTDLKNCPIRVFTRTMRDKLSDDPTATTTLYFVMYIRPSYVCIIEECGYYFITEPNEETVMQSSYCVQKTSKEEVMKIECLTHEEAMARVNPSDDLPWFVESHAFILQKYLGLI